MLTRALRAGVSGRQRREQAKQAQRSAQPLARSRTITADKIAGGHGFLALQLELNQIKDRTITTTHEQFVAANAQLPGRDVGGVATWPYCNKLEVLPAKSGVRAWPGLKATEPVV